MPSRTEQTKPATIPGTETDAILQHLYPVLMHTPPEDTGHLRFYGVAGNGSSQRYDTR